MDIKDLFYKPNIEPTRNYRSEGTISQEVLNQTIQIEEKPPLSQIEETYNRNVETVERLLRIRQITPLLPPKVIDTMNTLLDVVITGAWLDNEGPIQEIIKNESEEETKITETEITEKEEESEPETDQVQTAETNDNDDEWPELTNSGYELEVEENKNIWDYSKEQYLIDQSLIREAFSKEYNDIMEPYVYQLLTAMDEAGVATPESLNFEYEGETVTGINEDNQHLSDIIVRNQVALNEISDMFIKSHDLNETTAILSSYDIIAQERTRYFKEKYNEAAAQNYIEMYDKNLLAASRREYIAKYIAARANTYKFLHSAVAVSEDMLSLALASNIAKCSLIKKGINIFAKKEYQNEAVTNSTSVSSQQKNDKQEVDENKATDTSKAENKEDILDKLKIEDNYGGSSKDTQEKTKEAASGNTKTIAEDNKIKVRVSAAAKDKEEQRKQEGKSKPR